MKTLLLIIIVLLASCSDDEPQIPCEVLKSQLHAAQDEILDHQAKGSAGNPDAWETELRKLIAKKDKIQGEYKVRRCL